MNGFTQTASVLHTDVGAHQVNVLNSRELMQTDASGRHYMLYIDGANSTFCLRVWAADWQRYSDLPDICSGATSNAPNSFGVSPDGTSVHIGAPNGATGWTNYDVTLAGLPLPTAATLAATTAVDRNMYTFKQLLRLTSGADVAMGYTAGTFNATLPIQHGTGGYPISPVLWYRPSGGNWSAPIAFTWLEYSPTTSCDVTLAQHPADGGIWIFESMDDNQNINASRFIESGGTLSHTTDIKPFVQGDVNVATPAHAGGTQAMFSALPYPTTNKLLVIWYDNAYGTHAEDYGENAIRSGISFSLMYADGTHVITAPALVDAAAPFGGHFAPAVDAAGGIWAFYCILVDDGAGSVTTHTTHAARFNGTSWDGPDVLGTALSSTWIGLGSGASTQGAAAVLQADAPDYQAHLYVYTASAAPPPPPPPTLWDRLRRKWRWLGG